MGFFYFKKISKGLNSNCKNYLFGKIAYNVFGFGDVRPEADFAKTVLGVVLLLKVFNLLTNYKFGYKIRPDSINICETKLEELLCMQ